MAAHSIQAGGTPDLCRSGRGMHTPRLAIVVVVQACNCARELLPALPCASGGQGCDGCRRPTLASQHTAEQQQQNNTCTEPVPLSGAFLSSFLTR